MGIKTETYHGFARGDHGDSKQHIVTDLCDLTFSRSTAMDDVFAHMCQIDFSTLEIRVGIGTDHERESTGLRSLCA